MDNDTSLIALERDDLPDQPAGVDLASAALRRLAASGIEPIIPRFDCMVALNLSAPTISRMQRRGELPAFDEISPGRKGWQRSMLMSVLAGRRDWANH